MSRSSTTGSACTRPWATAPRPRRGPTWTGSPCARPRDVLIPPLHPQGTGPAGVIARYAAILGPAKVGLGVTLFARVWLTGQDEETVGPFVAAIQKLPQVIECHLMAGDCDFLLRVLARDLDDHRPFQVEHLGRIKGVRSIKTEIPMQKVKQSTELPVQGHE